MGQNLRHRVAYKATPCINLRNESLGAFVIPLKPIRVEASLESKLEDKMLNSFE